MIRALFDEITMVSHSAKYKSKFVIVFEVRKVVKLESFEASHEKIVASMTSSFGKLVLVVLIQNIFVELSAASKNSFAFYFFSLPLFMFRLGGEFLFFRFCEQIIHFPLLQGNLNV